MLDRPVRISYTLLVCRRGLHIELHNRAHYARISQHLPKYSQKYRGMPTITKRVRLYITPQTHVRTTQRDAICFRIPEADLIEKYPHLYKRKIRIERYIQYKRDLRIEAERVGFTLPTAGAWIKFFLPVPVSWSKKKKRKMNLEPHVSRPDASNLHKAFEDALIAQDMGVWDYRVSKFWYNSIKGFIEIESAAVNSKDMLPISISSAIPSILQTQAQ